MGREKSRGLNPASYIFYIVSIFVTKFLFHRFFLRYDLVSIHIPDVKRKYDESKRMTKFQYGGQEYDQHTEIHRVSAQSVNSSFDN